MMNVRVIPLLRLPRNMSEFDYAVPDDMRETCLPGTFVSIPFRNHLVAGLVCSSTGGDSSDLKPIHRVLPVHYLSWNMQYAYLTWFAHTSCISLATTLKTLLPSFPATFLSKGIIRKTYIRQRVPHPLVQLPVFESYFRIIQSVLNKEKNALIFFPAIHDVELFEPRARTEFGDDRVAVLHSELSPSDFFCRWLSLFEKKPRCILTTRVGAGVPLYNLGGVIIDASERREHNQYDMNPRYDVRTLAWRIHRLTKARLIFSSAAPRLEELAHPEMPDTVLARSASRSKKFLNTPVIIDMRNELRMHKRGYLSVCLIDQIAACLEKKRMVFLFLNRTGTSRLISCRDCGEIFSCSHCTSPYRTAVSQLICNRCRTNKPLPARCPFCKSVRFHFIALGTEKIVDLMRNEFPGARVLEITQQQFPKGLPNYFHREQKHEYLTNTIIVGTSYLPIACPEIFQDIGLVGVLAGDPSLNLSDFRAEEYHIQTLFMLQERAQYANASFLVQTFSPDSPHIRALRNGDYKTYAQKALEERRTHHWPPSTRLIRLRRTMSSRPKSRRSKVEVGAVDGSPIKTIETIIQNCHRLGATLRSKTHDSILLSIPARSRPDHELPKVLSTYLVSLPNEWLIDVDPIIL